MSDLLAGPGDLRAVTTGDLRQQLAQALVTTARHLTHVAAIWRELEHRGEDMSALRGGILAYMPLIAAGRLRAELVVQYAGHTTLLRRLAQLSVDDQDALLHDKTVVVVDHVDGAWSERRVPITHLRSQELAQVVGDRIRPPEEQRRAAFARSRVATRASKPDAIAAATSSIPVRRRDGVTTLISVSMSRAQRDALNRVAADRGQSSGRIILAALIVAGIVPEES